jgi:PTH1 family peptidyl-tRNA hydrolase
MRLVVGLGNPGPEHARQRHNVGFMAVDAIHRAHALGPWKARFEGYAAAGEIGGERVLALKPLTFMNDSGRAVGQAMRFHKLAPADVIVIHDEIDLAAGRLRVKKGGGNAGHNGLRSIDAHVGPEYWRVRIGIGHPGEKRLVIGYALHDFAKADHAWLDKLLDAIATEFPRLVAGDDNGFRTRVALLVDPPKPKPLRPAAPPAADAPEGKPKA